MERDREEPNASGGTGLRSGGTRKPRAARRPARRRRRRLRPLIIATALAITAGVYLAGQGLSPASPGLQRNSRNGRSGSTATAPARTTAARAAVATTVVVTPPAALTTGWATAASVNGHAAAWIAERSGGVTVMRFDQSLVHLTLHAGSSDGGIAGWTYGDQISSAEIHRIIAAVNGGFKLTYTNVGFESNGHVAVALKPGLGSLVTYTDGTSNVGAWDNGVPTSRKAVYSVLQNQKLLVDRGVAASTVTNCVLACWGYTVGSLTTVARAGIGITQDGQLVWAAGEQLSPAALAAALIGAGAVRAIELDINPDWVAGYLYVHHAPGPTAVPVVAGQRGIAGQLLAPYSRDFLAFVAS